MKCSPMQVYTQLTAAMSGSLIPTQAFQPSIHQDEPFQPIAGGYREPAQALSPSHPVGSKRAMNGSSSSGSSSSSISPASPQAETDQPSRTNRGGEESAPLPVCTIGLMSDIQYAPIPDGHSHSGTPRYYRHALSVARRAAQHFQDAQVNVLVNLGDIVDGKCLTALNPPVVGPTALDDVLDALSVYTHGNLLHIYGNHCLYNMDRRTIQSKLGVPMFAESDGADNEELVGYHSSLIPGTKVRLVVLDSYDVTVLQRHRTSRKRAHAVQLLRQYNAINYDAGEENSSEGLASLTKRFVAYNGGVGPVQLQWLDEQLDQSRQRDERVIVLSHQPILPGSCSPTCLMYNYQEVLTVVRRHSDVVLASLAGHAHKGGYRRDEVSGIHFRVVEAVLESPHPVHTYALLDVYPDRLQVRGFGDCQSAVYECDHQPPMSTRRHDMPVVTTSSRD